MTFQLLSLPALCYVCLLAQTTRSLNLQTIIRDVKPMPAFASPNPTQQTLSYLHHVGGKGDALSSVYVRPGSASVSGPGEREWFKVGFITACTYDEEEEEVRVARKARRSKQLLEYGSLRSALFRTVLFRTVPFRTVFFRTVLFQSASLLTTFAPPASLLPLLPPRTNGLPK
jgi:hypothetical protein